MGHASGSALFIQFIHSGGTTTISGDQRSMDWNEVVDTADTSAGADAYRTHVTTLKQVDGNMSLLDNGTDGTAIYAVIRPGSQGTLEWGPRGTDTGQPKFALPVTFTNSSLSVPYDGEIVRDYSWMGNGAWVTDGDNGGVW